VSYIHENSDWPNLTWDDAKLLPLLADVRHRQGRLLGRMEGLGFRLRAEASLTTLTSDVIKSSAIEGSLLTPRKCDLPSRAGWVLISEATQRPAVTWKAWSR